MAHVGRFYKVLFRRDWNLNISDNAQGHANRYIVTLPEHLGTGIGTIIEGTIWDCGPGRLSIRDTQLWQAPFIRRAALHWQVEIESIIQTPDNSYAKRLRINVAEVGTIAEVEIGTDGSRLVGFPEKRGTLLSWDSDFFDGPPVVLGFLDIRTKNWADGLPQ